MELIEDTVEGNGTEGGSGSGNVSTDVDHDISLTGETVQVGDVEVSKLDVVFLISLLLFLDKVITWAR